MLMFRKGYCSSIKLPAEHISCRLEDSSSNKDLVIRSKPKTAKTPVDTSSINPETATIPCLVTHRVHPPCMDNTDL